MFNNTEVHVSSTGKLKHPLFGRFARPIRKAEREKLKSVFKHGRKPYMQYMDALASKSSESILAGNYDELGSSTSVLQKNIKQK